MSWTTTGEESVAGGVDMLVYGPPGVGKTVLGATFENPIYLVTRGEGMLSLSNSNQVRLWGEAREIPIFKLNKPSELKEFLDFMRTPEGRSFDGIVFDSLSDYFKILLEVLKKINKDGRKAYGELYDQGLSLVRDFRALPQHTLFIAEQDREKDGENGRLLYRPSFPGAQLTKDVPHIFDEVFCFQIHTDDKGKSERWLLCNPTQQFFAKDRSGALDEYEQPNLTEIINKIRQ